MTNEYDFEFSVTGIENRNRIKAIFNIIVMLVENCGGSIAGGFIEVSEEESDSGQEES